VETEVSGVEGDRRVDVLDDVTDAHCGHCALLRVVFSGIQTARKPPHPAPTFAMLSRGDLRLLLSAPSGAGGGGQAMPDGTMPEPGGWNRFSLEVSDLAAMVEELRKADVHFRNDIVTGVGGKQVLVDDPSGNPIELFEPSLPEASLSSAETHGD